MLVPRPFFVGVPGDVRFGGGFRGRECGTGVTGGKWGQRREEGTKEFKGGRGIRDQEAIMTCRDGWRDGIARRAP